MALKWGIAGAGLISHDFVTAVQILPSADHQIVAVAARSQTSADKFSKEHNIPSAYEGYDGLAKDQNVEIVYIGVLNPQHYEVSKLMLESGKHVLCEKPFTMNEKQTRALIDLAKQKKLFLMEAVWSRFFQAYSEMKNIIDSNSLGEAKFVSAHFGFKIANIDRIKSKELGGGTILDLGIYVLQFQQFIFRGLKPINVVATGILNEEGIDIGVSISIIYPENKMATLVTSALVELDNEAVVACEKGVIKMPHFWCPTKLITPEKTCEYELPKSKIAFNYRNSSGLSFEAEEARRCIRARNIESEVMPLNETLELAQLMDNVRRQVGVVFAADKE